MYLISKIFGQLNTGYFIFPLIFYCIPFFSSHANEQTFSDGNKKKPYLEQRINFEHISLEQGLSQISVTCITQNKKSFVWFGTQGMINKIVLEKNRFNHYKRDSFIPKVYQEKWSGLFVRIARDCCGLDWREVDSV